MSLILTVALCIATPPSNQAGEIQLPKRRTYRGQPPRSKPSLFSRWGLRFGLEVGLGLYRPGIDAEFSTATPHQDLFGNSSALLGQLRLHTFVPTRIGEIGLVAGVGYSVDDARNLDDNGERTAGRSTIRLIPLLSLVRWRTLAIERLTGLPLAFSLAGGLNYTFWTITRGDGRVAEADDTRGDGASLSVQAEAGLGIRLTRFDEHSARRLSRDFGISDTELGFAVTYISTPIAWRSLAVGGLSWRGYLLLQF